MPERPATGEPPRPEGQGSSGWQRRLARAELLLNRTSASPRARRTLLVVALVAFLAISAVSFDSLRGGLHFHWWAFLLLAFGATPLMLLVNCEEYRAVGAVAGQNVGWIEGLRLTVLATAANLFPLPGGVLIRTQALRQKGSSYKRALYGNAAAGIAWVAMGLLAVGALFVATGERRVAGIVMLALAVVSVALLWRALRRTDGAAAVRHLLRLLIVELVTVGVSALSVVLAFAMLGFHVTAAQAVALAGAVIISTAIGIFPAGLGLREALAGAIGAAVNLRAVEAVAAIAAERVAILVGMAVLTAVLLASWRAGRQQLHGLTSQAQLAREESAADAR